MKEKNICNEKTGGKLTIRLFDEGHISLFVLPYKQEWWISVPLDKKQSKELIDFIKKGV